MQKKPMFSFNFNKLCKVIYLRDHPLSCVGETHRQLRQLLRVVHLCSGATRHVCTHSLLSAPGDRVWTLLHTSTGAKTQRHRINGVLCLM